MKQKHYAFSAKAIASPTPSWAKNMFRFVMWFNVAVSAWLYSTTLVTTEAKLEITLLLNVIITPAVNLLAKMFGVVPADKE